MEEVPGPALHAVVALDPGPHDLLDALDEVAAPAELAQVEEDPNLDDQAKAIQIATKRNVEQRKLDDATARIERDKDRTIREAMAERDAKKRSLYNKYRVVMFALAFLPAMLMGLITFARRRARESAIVPQNRMVK